MAFPTQSQIDVIATAIRLDAKQALLMLKAWSNSITDATAKTKLLKDLVRATAAQMNGDFQGATAAVQRFSKALNVNPAAIKSLGDEMRKAGQAGNKMSEGFQRAISTVNILRIAMGALISMILFQAIQAFSQFFSTASKQARQLEETLYRLGNVERDLSLKGIEISLKGLEDGIDRIRKKMPIFSREDISQLVGTIAISTKQLRLTEQQILDLSQAIAVLNIRSEKQEDLSTTAQHVLSSLLTGNAKGITQLGIAFTDNVMKAKAMELGFLDAGEAISKLTENEKGITKLNIVLESTGGELSAVNDYLETNSAKVLANKAAWADLLTTIGQGINNLIPNVVPALEKMQKAIELGSLSKLFKGASPNLGTEDASWMDAKIWIKLGLGIKFTTEEYERLKFVLSRLSDEEILKIFPDPSAIKDRFTRELVQSLVTIKDTATGMPDPLIPDVVDEDALEALEDLEDKIQDILLDAKQAQEDLDIRRDQKREDLDLEYLRKEADAETDHAQKLEDINRDTLDKIEDAKRKSREAEGKEEQKLLQRLKELREKFLLDLEDALHARDARAVLRLIKEYKLEKQNILDRAALDKQQRKEALAEDIKNIEIDRQRRIEDAKIEYQRKLEDLALAKQREQDELQVWYQREQEDIQRNIEQKLEKLLAGYINEEKLHVEHQEAIQKILAKYFGEDMELMGSLTQFMADQFAQVAGLAQATAAMIGSLNYGLGLPNQTNPFAGSLSANYVQPLSPYQQSEWGFAEGGTVIATRPTRAIFGERGPEAATFTPLGRTGRDAGKLFGGAGGGGVNGQIMVAVDLSPDLEGRVVNKSMDGVAEIIAKVNRTKL